MALPRLSWVGVLCTVTVAVVVKKDILKQAPGHHEVPGDSHSVAFLGPALLETSAQTPASSASFLNMYTATLVPLGIATLTLAWMTRPKTDEELTPEFRKFRWEFLSVWVIAVGADWLQGPYVYDLYDSYGYSPHDINVLFVVGFGASMVFGTFVGSLADSLGRKKTCVVYCVLYIFSCLTKHFTNYYVLMVGRLTGGISTSILFSCFESWMVYEHVERHGFSPGLLDYMFSMMYFAMYAVAIACGIVAQFVVDSFPLKDIPGIPGAKWGGSSGPFDLSILFLCACILPLAFRWGENYGKGSTEPVTTSLYNGGRTFFANWRIALMGAVVTGFEGAMYAFVINWTPVLSTKDSKPPHGLTFSMFMMACMCGSSIYSIVGGAERSVSVLLPTLVLAAMSLVAVTVVVNAEGGSSPIAFFFFLIFECCVGLYFPSSGSLKSRVVPEDVRATVYNIYRVPLNAVVVILNLCTMSETATFALCSTLVLLAAITVVPMSKPLSKGSEKAPGESAPVKAPFLAEGGANEKSKQSLKGA